MSELEQENEDISLNYQTVKLFIEYKLIREFVLFQKQNLSHIYIIPSYESAFKWNGVMFIHHGLYTDSILKFTVKIPEDYPNSQCPVIIFNPIPFHPLIDPKNGELNTRKEFPTWKPSINKIWHVILFAKKIFYLLDKEISNIINNTSPVINDPLIHPQNPDELKQNEINLGDHYNETMNFFKNNFKSYQAKVEESIRECHAKLYDNPEDSNLDLHAIQFGPWNPKEHKILRKKLIKGIDIMEEFNNLTVFKEEENQLNLDNNKSNSLTNTNGFSWMVKGSIFSKHDL